MSYIVFVYYQRYGNLLSIYYGLFIPDILPISEWRLLSATVGLASITTASKIDQGCLEAQEPLSMNQSSHSELSGQHPLSQRLGTSIKFPTLFKCYPKQISSTLDKLKCRPSEILLLKISAVKSHISLLPNRANFLSSRFPHWTEKLPVISGPEIGRAHV